MSRDDLFWIPSAGSLIAFESAARHRSFSRAAQELNTSQPAISRKIAKLERELCTLLFNRSKTGVTLTEAGMGFRDAVVAGLGIIRAAASEAADLSGRQQLVIACSYDSSHLVLMPRYRQLQETLGDDVGIRVLTFYRDQQELPPTPAADLILTWERPLTSPENRVAILQEAVRPICSRGYIAANADVLNGPVSGWSELTLLDVTPPHEGWANWDDWFQAAGYPKSAPKTLYFDHYTYVLDAAATGCGIALGWRGCIEPFLRTGAMVAVTDDYVELDSFYYGALTQKGKTKPVARQCLEWLKSNETR